MADQTYNLKVKNTFLEVDVDDDVLDHLSLDEDEFKKRQLTEPVPPTTRLLDIHLPPNIPKSTDYSDNLEESTTSSEHDPEATEPFQPESEPEFTDNGNEMVRQVTEELCWNVWSDTRWEPDVECISPSSPYRGAASQYDLEPSHHTLSAGVSLGHGETSENVQAHRSSSRQQGKDSASSSTKTPRRHKQPESLIDAAARKQKQELRKAKQQAKHASQEQFGRQPASNAQQSKCVRGDTSKAKLGKSCHQCGGKVHMDWIFCRFCGVAL
jgi:hypothetical protein